MVLLEDDMGALTEAFDFVKRWAAMTTALLVIDREPATMTRIQILRHPEVCDGLSAGGGKPEYLRRSVHQPRIPNDYPRSR